MPLPRLKRKCPKPRSKVIKSAEFVRDEDDPESSDEERHWDYSVCIPPLPVPEISYLSAPSPPDEDAIGFVEYINGIRRVTTFHDRESVVSLERLHTVGEEEGLHEVTVGHCCVEWSELAGLPAHLQRLRFQQAKVRNATFPETKYSARRPYVVTITGEIGDFRVFGAQDSAYRLRVFLRLLDERMQLPRLASCMEKAFRTALRQTRNLKGNRRRAADSIIRKREFGIELASLAERQFDFSVLRRSTMSELYHITGRPVSCGPRGSGWDVTCSFRE